jgi:GAF domain-containing protein
MPTPDLTAGAADPVGSLAERLVGLGRVIAEVAGASDAKAVCDIVTTSVAEILGADAASLAVVDGAGEINLVGSMRRVEIDAPTHMPIDAPQVVAEVIRTKTAVMATTLAEIHERWPDHLGGVSGPHSLVALPLLAGDQCVGALGFLFPDESVHGDLDRQYLNALADTCAQAILRITASESAAESGARLTFLANASAELAASLDYEVTLRRVAELAVPTLADWCAIDLLEEGGLRRVAVAHVDPSKVALAWELWERFPPQMDAPTGVPAVIRTGASELVETVDDELLDSLQIEPELRRLIDELELRSSIVVPLSTAEGVLGGLTLVWAESGRRYVEADIPFVEDLARRAAIAIDNSRLHTDTSEAALQLQRAILPESYRDSSTWKVAVHYRPAGRSHLVGGDFYDALTLRDGRLVALVGDVMGRGVAAAASMAQVRSACRAYLSEDPRPHQVLSRLDAMFAALDLEQLVTLIYFLLDSTAGTAEILSAGHLQPLLVSSAGAVTPVDVPVSPPLGTGCPDRRSITVPFTASDTLLAYTDGLVERRGEDIDQGTARLIELAGDLAHNFDDVALASLADRLRHAGHDDDVTLLAVRPIGSH